MDRRLLPANARVALASLKGQVEAEQFVDAQPRQVARTVLNLTSGEDQKPLERQLLFGEVFNVLETRNGRAFGYVEKDGYVGWVDAEQLTDVCKATHIVSSNATHLYSAANIKAPTVMPLSFGSRLRIVSADGEFFEIHGELFVPKPHVRPANLPFSDAASVAQLFFGTPYLWGGNSSFGIDCSGLIQAALLVTGHACPGDSDLQEKAVGQPVALDAPIQRGDLFFWKGHVAMAVDGETLIHATSHTMAVSYENIDAVIQRIDAHGEGPVTSRRRL